MQCLGRYLIKLRLWARISAVALCSLILSACVATYKSAEEGVAGYRDLLVNPNTFYVEYTESASVSWEQIHDFALRRCAEIAQSRGYPVFDVVSKQERTIFLESTVNEIEIAGMGNIASDPPVHNVFTTGGKHEGRRVTYKIELLKE